MDRDDHSKRPVAADAHAQVVVEGSDWEKSCCSPDEERVCCAPGTEGTGGEPSQDTHIYKSGCAVCGLPLIYYWEDKESTCFFCGQVLRANAGCLYGHFVCDHCHGADGIEIIKTVCLHSGEVDMVKIMRTIRSHPLFRIHGPEHHSMVPAVILTALRNSGHPVSDEEIRTAVNRGETVGGGACAFLGACGAAIGAGIAISLVLKASPYDGEKRQIVQQVVQAVLTVIASYKAPRCCQRDSWLALKEVTEHIRKHTGKTLAVDSFACDQFSRNKECIYKICPLWPSGSTSFMR